MMRLWITSPAFPPRPETSDQLDGAGRAESVALAQRQAQSQEKTERIGRTCPDGAMKRTAQAIGMASRTSTPRPKNCMS